MRMLINVVLSIIVAAHCLSSRIRPQITLEVASKSDTRLKVDQTGNVVKTIAPSSLTNGPSVATFDTEDLIRSWKPPLSTRGRYVVDADGIRFRLKAGNWHGASGTYTGRGDINDPSNHHAGEQAYQTPLCLDRTPLDEIVQSFLDLGINSIRLPFSNEMIYSTDVPPDSALRANPQLRGLTPLQIFDACIAALTRRGIAVILNNHTTKNLWCCGPDSNARWNSGQSDEQWEHDWVFMVKRYKNDARVVGAELRNEVRRDLLKDATWGEGGDADWWLASQNAGSKILREANADILIIIEGINYVGIPTPYTKHWRPELQPVRSLSHTMPVLDKLVYAAHFYSYTGPNATGGPQFGTHDKLYRDLNTQQLEDIVNNLAFYVATPSTQKQEHYTNPVFISETGSGGRNDFLHADREWWPHFASLLVKYDIDFALWPLVGWHERARGDLWALNAWDAMGNLLSILQPGDWRFPAFSYLIRSNGKTGVVKRTPQQRMLTSALGSMQMSNHLYHQTDLVQPGDIKLSCPDGLRISAISHDENHTVICTDALLVIQSSDGLKRSLKVVTTPNDDVYDFGKGRSWQCPLDHHLIGFSLSKSKVKSIVCAQATPATLSNAEVRSRTVKLERKRRYRATVQQTESWHSIEAKVANCRDDEVLVGLTSSSSSHQADPISILCRRLHSLATKDRIDKRVSSLFSTIFKTYLWTLASKIPFIIL